ncbi:MAG: plastocyanin/azurin family copper-binding protein [Actinomycetota bacterium]
MRARVLKSTVVSVAMIAALGACGSDSNDSSDSTSNDITGSIAEWTVETDATTAKAGEVVFTVTNDGTIGHEFLVVKTDMAPGEIPLDGDHFAEPTDGLEVIDEIGEFAKGTTETLTVTLDPGNYQLVCNLPDHYSAGMSMAFTVVA